MAVFRSEPGGWVVGDMKSWQLGVISAIAGVALGAFATLRFCAPMPTVIAPSSDKVDEVRQQVDAKTYVAEKQAVTKRHEAAKRVADEVQRETAASDLADYLRAHRNGGDGAADRRPQGLRRPRATRRPLSCRV